MLDIFLFFFLSYPVDFTGQMPDDEDGWITLICEEDIYENIPGPPATVPPRPSGRLLRRSRRPFLAATIEDCPGESVEDVLCTRVIAAEAAVGEAMPVPPPPPTPPPPTSPRSETPLSQREAYFQWLKKLL